MVQSLHFRILEFPLIYVCMCIFLYVYLYIYIYLWAHVYLCLHLHLYIEVKIYNYMYNISIFCSFSICCVFKHILSVLLILELLFHLARAQAA